MHKGRGEGGSEGSGARQGRAGGGSGQNVIDPRKLMDKARADGAVSGAEHEGNSSSAFVGAGAERADGWLSLADGFLEPCCTANFGLPIATLNALHAGYFLRNS